MKWESTYGPKGMGDHLKTKLSVDSIFCDKSGFFPFLGTHVCLITEMHLAPVLTLKIQ